MPRHSCLRSHFRPTFEELLKVTGIKIGGKGSGKAEGSGEKGDWLSFSLFFFYSYCSNQPPPLYTLLLDSSSSRGHWKIRIRTCRSSKSENRRGCQLWDDIPLSYIVPLQPRRLRFNLPVDELKIDRRLGRRTLEITYIWNSHDPPLLSSRFSPPKILEESKLRDCSRARLTRLSTFPRLLNTTRSNRTIRRPTPTAPR